MPAARIFIRRLGRQFLAPADGRVAEVRVVIGQQVENGAVLLVFEESADNGEKP